MSWRIVVALIAGFAAGLMIASIERSIDPDTRAGIYLRGKSDGIAQAYDGGFEDGERAGYRQACMRCCELDELVPAYDETTGGCYCMAPLVPTPN